MRLGVVKYREYHGKLKLKIHPLRKQIDIDLHPIKVNIQFKYK